MSEHLEVKVNWLETLTGSGITDAQAAAFLAVPDNVRGLREQLGRQLRETAHALRTQDDYDFRCQDCGAPHNLDTSLPSEAWNAICENRPGILPGAAGIGMPEVGALCTLCIDERLVKAGLTAECEFYYVGRALRSRLYDASVGELEALRRRLAAAEHVPGDWACPTCHFELHKRRLHAADGSVSVNDQDEAELCPNDGATLRRVTWLEHVDKMMRSIDEWVDRARAIDKRQAELQGLLGEHAPAVLEAWKRGQAARDAAP